MVNTFLTNEDFKISAKSLDRARLGKQRVEAYQILNLIEDIKRLSILLEIEIDPKNLKLSISKTGFCSVADMLSIPFCVYKIKLINFINFLFDFFIII